MLTGLRTSSRRFYDIVGDNRAGMGWLFLLFLIGAMFEMSGIALIATFVTGVTAPEAILMHPVGQWLGRHLGISSQFALISFLGGVLLVVIVLRAICMYWTHWKKQDFMQALRARMINRLMTVYLTVPWSFHLDRSSAKALLATSSHTRAFVVKVLGPILNIAVSIITGLGIVVVLGLINFWATVVVLVGTAIAIGLVDWLTKSKLRAYNRQYVQTNQYLLKSVQQGILAGKELRVLGCERSFAAETDGLGQVLRWAGRNQIALSRVPQLALEVVIVTFVVLYCLTAFSQGGTGSQALATLSAFAFASLRLVPMTSRIGTSVANLRNAGYTLERLHEDLTAMDGLAGDPARPPLDACQNSESPAEAFESLQVENVDYAYPGSESRPSLSAVNLHIRRGESIGVVGKSGAGKTTLMDVLLGLLAPSAGEILVNGQPMSTSMAYWRRVTAYVPQDAFLLDDSVMRNVAFGIAPDAIDVRQVWSALRAAQLDGFVEALPDQLGTQLGERGVRLSGGQRQRIALARAFYHDRQVLFLDEATSALDTETEQEIIQAIDAVRQGKTLIVIAHRLATVAHCDRILKIENGRLVEDFRGPEN